MLISTYVIHQ